MKTDVEPVKAADKENVEAEKPVVWNCLGGLPEMPDTRHLEWAGKFKEMTEAGASPEFARDILTVLFVTEQSHDLLNMRLNIPQILASVRRN